MDKIKQTRGQTHKKDNEQINLLDDESNRNVELVEEADNDVTPEYKVTTHEKTITRDQDDETQNKIVKSNSHGSVLKSGLVKQKIKSEPNPEQTNDLRILYVPNLHFEQEGQYLYPVVKVPKPNSILKLPRDGRSNQKGYKENHFLMN